MARAYQTFRLSDQNLLDALQSIIKTSETKNGNLHLRIDEQQGQTITCPIEQIGTNADIAAILSLKATIVGNANLVLGAPYNSSVVINRVGVSDTVTINIRNELALPLAGRLVHAVQSSLKPYERDESFDKLLGSEMAEFYRKREQGLVRLEELAQRIIEQNEIYRTKLDKDAQVVQQGLHDKVAARAKELEGGFLDRSEALRKREDALTSKLAEIDDRSSRHARRQIRQDLKNAIAQRGQEFTLTKKTTQKRGIIHGVFISLIVTLVALLIHALLPDQNTSQGAAQWFHLARLPLLSIGTVAAFIYYIRWNDEWFRRHADEEFRIKRLELDVDRASWLVEMAMEWKDEKGTDIPHELVDRLSANLFEKATDDKKVRHPSEDMLSALLSASSELNLNLPGVGTVRLDRKGTKQFKEDIAKAQ